MAVRPLVYYPHPVLRRAAEPVLGFGRDLQALAEDLLDTMKAAPGVGITAPHIGVLLRVTVIQLDAAQEPRTYVNPRILWSSDETIRHTEGSVSMPGVTEDIERPAHVRVGYQDTDGVERQEEASGFMAVCLQHEIDQLDGIFWIDHLSRLRRERVIKRYEKLRRVKG
ncbi:peptide deformylase [Microvirga subterranea]|uniref:Peptide deformylase-like n=1 Tax=Microvirga subterranea TaxID=186651 RepID=A0A370HK87_9HYPH|nr:peptide deformylase [Microvirga subterranea]RDI58585.1 peptide deformylase [Microvirga subterranea]